MIPSARNNEAGKCGNLRIPANPPITATTIACRMKKESESVCVLGCQICVTKATFGMHANHRFVSQQRGQRISGIPARENKLDMYRLDLRKRRGASVKAESGIATVSQRFRSEPKDALDGRLTRNHYRLCKTDIGWKKRLGIQ